MGPNRDRRVELKESWEVVSLSVEVLSLSVGVLSLSVGELSLSVGELSLSVGVLSLSVNVALSDEVRSGEGSVDAASFRDSYNKVISSFGRVQFPYI
jgi:hypothetical protein